MKRCKASIKEQNRPLENYMVVFVPEEMKPKDETICHPPLWSLLSRTRVFHLRVLSAGYPRMCSHSTKFFLGLCFTQNS